MKKIYEIEIFDDLSDKAQYIYVEADEDIEIDIKEGGDSNVTHIATLFRNVDVEPDLVITRRKDG